MKPTHIQRYDFFALRPVFGLTFAFKDYVNVISGEFSGKSGTLVSIEEMGADPIYLVQLDPGIQASLPASFLQAEGDN